MEARQIQCDNLGMNRDQAISMLGKDKSGVTNFAFENHNIRILANGDNTALAVTNERSTKAELVDTATASNAIPGTFLGACKLNKYLVLFIKDESKANLLGSPTDSIYRIHFDGKTLQKVLLYNGNLNFDLSHPIEAKGYYESEEVQKVYWVDGYNANRFINIAKVLYEIQGTSYTPQQSQDIVLPDGVIHTLCTKDGTASYCYYTSGGTTTVWSYTDVYNALYPNNTAPTIFTVSALLSAGLTTYDMEISGTKLYDNKIAPFDFQGSISKIPVAKITKNYNEAGTFAAGVIQYFFTYYNKYGVETPIIWNSDVQYISLQDRGAKQDETVNCGFDFEIDANSLESNDYEYLRIYACYRSSLDVVASARLVAEISLSNLNAAEVPTLYYTDLGNAGETINAADLKYLGGQNLIANTLDYKQDTLFLGNLQIPGALSNTCEPLMTDTTLDILEDTEALVPKNVVIKESNGISWVYKCVSNHHPKGIYSYESELKNSQEEIAGFKWREIYRFGIQFMTPTGEWTDAQWIGDKYCTLPPTNLAQIRLRAYNSQGVLVDVMGFEADGAVSPKIEGYQSAAIMRSPSRFGNDNLSVRVGLVNPEYKVAETQSDGTYHLKNYQGEIGRDFDVLYTEDGYYIATAQVDLQKVFSPNDYQELKRKYVGYRLLMADVNINDRRIVEQGVINPTMFNYTDRYYNRPYSIPSWIFRPRLSEITNRHYDTLPVQTERNAELQGIIKRQVPGFDDTKTADGGSYNAYLLVLAANDGGSYMKWKLIYYNCAHYNEAVATWAANQSPALPYTSGTSASDIQCRKTANYAYISAKCKDSIENGGALGMSALFQNDYMVVSSGTLNKVAGKWEQVYGEFLSTLTQDIKGKKDINDHELPQIFSSVNLPDAAMLKDIAFAKGDTSYIGAIVGLAIAVAAAVVASVFTAGAAAPAAGAAAATMATIIASEITFATVGAAVGAMTSVVSGLAIAGAAGLATVASNKDKYDGTELLNKMSVKGFIPVNKQELTPASAANIRSKTGLRIDDLFRALFSVNTTDIKRKDGNPTYYSALKGDTDKPFTHNPHLKKQDGNIGMDYNAFYTAGLLSLLDDEENDLKGKANVFCVDESIVTMNAPDVEETVYSVENSDAYDLQLVGLVPIQSAYGTYDLQCTNGLASSSEVLRGRFSVPSSVPTTDILGLLNGDLYQDTDINEDSLIASPAESTFNAVEVAPKVALYRQWMWNRDTSIGMWMPGITILDPLRPNKGEEGDPKTPIQIASAQPTHKLFANLRYSFGTSYKSPFSLAIEAPKVCLDAQTMLKTFSYGDDTKFYYENVNTISTNVDSYGLVKNGTVFPQEREGWDMLATAALKDPIQIKYKEAPHILLPIKTRDAASVILPYIEEEAPVTPYGLYGDALGNTVLPGLETIWPDSSTTYHYLSTTNTDGRDIIAESGLFNFNNPNHEFVFSTTSYKEKAWISVCFNNELREYFDTLYASDAQHFFMISTQTFNELRKHATKYLINSGGSALYELSFENNTEKITQLCGPNNITYTGLKAWDKILVQSYYDKNALTSYYLDSNHHFIVPGDPNYKLYRSVFSGDSDSDIKGSLRDGDTKRVYSDIEDSFDNPGTITLVYDEDANLDNHLRVYPTWTQTKLPWKTDGYPYLFMGELVKKVFNYEFWMGGRSEYALKQLHWNVASPVTTVLQPVTNRSWGDTYYQRWDCEKTYPFTEEDKNSVVEVLSFMLESHVNLDGRSDINRGTTNLLNLRPTNTTFNPVYGQKDNFFSYSMLDEKFKKTMFEADVAWSLTKNNMSDVDSWTSFVSSNQMSLDGRFGAVRKILNVGDTLLAFQDTGISVIRYNEDTALTTAAGLPLQLGNTGKVNGYRIVAEGIGCHNKFSINKNTAGVFFTDDYNKAFMSYTQNGGIKDIGQDAAFSQWFKDNITGNIWSPKNSDAFRTSYDEVTHDLYIITNNTCLLYNTLLQRFTSFMDYVNTPVITRLNSDDGKSGAFAIRMNEDTANKVEGWQLFEGDAYNRIYGKPVSYSMEYRINPDPTHDSIFTNYQYTADWLAPTSKVDNSHTFGAQSSSTPASNPQATVARRYTTFDTVAAWNEFQYGKKRVDTGRVGSFPAKAKFRIWRGDIPRDGEDIGKKVFMPDRMRNPWLHLKFEKVITEVLGNENLHGLSDDSKMIFHNLNVTYYNQYGRF